MTSKMPNPVMSELNRLQHIFNSIINELNQTTQQQQVDDVEAIPQLQMPGGLDLPTSETQNSEDNSNTNKVENLFKKLLLIIAICVLLIVFLPIYVIYMILMFLFVSTVSIYNKIHQGKYSNLRNTDPSDIARRFIMNFDERIGNNLAGIDSSDPMEDQDQPNTLIEGGHLGEIGRPDFLECAYSQALYIVKKDIRWLLCYIESGENQECVDFTKEVLVHPVFLKFIKNKNFLVWGGDISDSEAFQVCNQFNITKLPFLGLLCMTVNQIPTSSGMQQSEPVLSLVSKIQGYKDLETTIHKLQRAYSKYNPIVSQLKRDNPESLQGVVRELQDEALQNSIRRIRPLRNSYSREPQRRSREEKRLQWLKWRKSTLEPEPNEPGQYARLAIKFPDGSRKQIKIGKTSSLEEIYATLECMYLNEVELGDATVYQCPDDYEHEYRFRIYTVMPKQIIPMSSNITIEETTSIYPSGNLVVEMVVD